MSVEDHPLLEQFLCDHDWETLWTERTFSDDERVYRECTDCDKTDTFIR